MPLIKVFVNPDMTAPFSCDACGKSFQRDVSGFMGHQKQVRLRYKCPCGKVSPVLLERRRSVRKSVGFKGCFIQGPKEYKGIVTDLSRHGIRFQTMEKAFVKADAAAEIRFILDNPNQSEISRIVRIKKEFSPYLLGCEFIDQDHFDDLGKYFLFHF